uniref:non-specific serine/threonine protein kinase n=1 Tax=Alexandrium catenella TaxID=2925 RepID=A0A7S1LSK5_ALECA
MAHLSAAVSLKTWLPSRSSVSRKGKGTSWTSWLHEQEWFRHKPSAPSTKKSAPKIPDGPSWLGGCLGRDMVRPASSSSVFSREEIVRDPPHLAEVSPKHCDCPVPDDLVAETISSSGGLTPGSRLRASAFRGVGADSPVTQPDAERDESTDSLAMSPTFSHTFSQENPGELHTFYEVHGKRLGEGAFGSVRRATCRQSGLERAVKSVSLKAVKHLADFEREICVAKSLDHPNICRLYETFRDVKNIHLVIELCTGGELFDKVVGSDGLGENTAASYVRQMLEAVCYLHAHFLVHRDIKPENFLLQNSSPDAALKMIDFGLARTFEPGVPMSTRVGTAYYVAPQVLRGEYDEKCDIWSVGVILYILLCGYPPFYGDNDETIFKQIKRGYFEFPSPDWDKISTDAKAMVNHMLTSNVTRRPSAEAALTNPWLKRKNQSKSPLLAGSFMTSLQNFMTFNTLKKVALTAVAQQLPDEETEHPRKLFRSLDKNGDGMLSCQEIREGMMQQGLAVPNEMEDIVRAVDSDGSGQLDYSEFIAATMDEAVCTKKHLCRAAFRIFDTDGDGKITREELERAISSPTAREEEAAQIHRLIGEGDSNGDGCIDFEEFCAMIAPSPKQRQEAWNSQQGGGKSSSVLLGREGQTSLRLISSVAHGAAAAMGSRSSRYSP